MSTAQMESLWAYIESLSLSQRNRKWLADHLVMPVEKAINEDGWEASPELLEQLDKARQEISEGNCVTLRTKEDLNAFFEAL